MWWNKYIKIPFKEKGRDFNGCDCWGLVRLIYKNELNIELPSFLYDYENTKELELISKIISDNRNVWVTPEKHKPFDLVLLNMGGFPMHLGLVTNGDFMIHCQKDVNTVIEKFTSTSWKTRVRGFGRYDTTRSICNSVTA